MRHTLTLLACLAATPAAATGTVFCQDPTGSGTTFSYGHGRVPGLAVISADISANGVLWRMPAAAGAEPLVVAAAAHETGDGQGRILIDFADDAVIEIVASVRLVHSAEGDAIAIAGTLHMPGIGTWPLICDGF